MNENFKSYINSQMNRKHQVDLEVTIKTPSQIKGLQVVDFVSWAIFRSTKMVTRFITASLKT